jgi:hypothetical protein
VEENRDQSPASTDAQHTLAGLTAAMVEGYLDLPLPIPPDDQVAAVVNRFATADENFRDALRENLSLAQYDVLLAFAIRMAMLAVRERSTARLRLGVQAVALAGDAPTADWRETGEPVLSLSDAASRIGANAREEFANAARLAGARTAGFLRSVARQSAFRVAIERLMMSSGLGTWKAIHAPDGFRYVPTRRVSRAEVEELIRRVEQAKRDAH